jgi:hypothetical protein
MANWWTRRCEFYGDVKPQRRCVWCFQLGVTKAAVGEADFRPAREWHLLEEQGRIERARVEYEFKIDCNRRGRFAFYHH